MEKNDITFRIAVTSDLRGRRMEVPVLFGFLINKILEDRPLYCFTLIDSFHFSGPCFFT